jgi:hypothetical protein
MDLNEYTRGGQNTFGGHQLRRISTIFPYNCINFQQKTKLEELPPCQHALS